MAPVESVHMVHGAWADGSAWAKVIPILKSHSLQPAAAQNTLVPLDLDVAGILRIIDSQPGQVVLVGHSYVGSETSPPPNPQIIPLPKHFKRSRKSAGNSFY